MAENLLTLPKVFCPKCLDELMTNGLGADRKSLIFWHEPSKCEHSGKRFLGNFSTIKAEEVID